MPSDRSLSRFSMAIPDSWLRASGKLNVPLYRFSRGRLGGKVGRAPVCLLTTTGRRSGQARTAPVLYLANGDPSNPANLWTGGAFITRTTQGATVPTVGTIWTRAGAFFGL